MSKSALNQKQWRRLQTLVYHTVIKEKFILALSDNSFLFVRMILRKEK